MRYLRNFKESKEEISDFIEYLELDLEDDNLTIRNIGVNEFIYQKYKNMSSHDARSKEIKSFFYADLHIFEISGLFNLYDIETHIRRLIDKSKILGYNKFEIRKITQMSRRSLEVTQSFLRNRSLPESSKREIIRIHILIVKL